MISAGSYHPALRDEWNQFVAVAKNGHFFFNRDFQEYHADRFPDASLMVRDEGRLIGLLPASRVGSEVVSHGGLTFGGVLSDQTMTVARMCSTFETFLDCFRKSGVKRLVYKAIPHYYHLYPAEEDLYALLRFGARLVRRDVCFVLQPAERPKLYTQRRKSLKKATSRGVSIAESRDYASYWGLLEEVIGSRHGAAPVHSIKEILYLSNRFPENVRLYTAALEGRVIAGTVLFINKGVAHTQYIGANNIGRDTCALDMIFDSLINVEFTDRKWFSFGTTNGTDGKEFNFGLADWKEGFGARACAHDFYEIAV